MKVKFDLKYRQQIESGEYKVETANGRQVRIICWDARNWYRESDVVALVSTESGKSENILRYYSNGHLISDSANIGNKDLVVIIPDEDERIKNIITDSVFYQYGAGAEYKDVLDYLDKLERQKEPHYTKRNTLFDKCVKNCDPEVMKEVSDNVDEMLRKEQKSDGRGKATINGEPIPTENQSVNIPLAEWNEDKYPKNIENAATMFCFDNGLNITPHQAVMIAKHFYELGFKRIGDGRA